MSFNGSGLFQINSSGQPVVTGTVISATVFNALTADIGTGLSTCITKDGQTAATARIPFAAGISSTLTTETSSASTGSIITSGGIGITKSLFVGAGIIYVGGTTSSDVSLRRSTSTMLCQLGDASGDANFRAGQIIASGDVLYFGGVTSSNTLFKRTTTTILARLGDDSAPCNFSAAQIIAASDVVYWGGALVTNVLIKRTSTTLLIRKGDDSAAAALTCGTLTPTLLVYNFGNFTGSGTYTNFTIVDGQVTAAS